MPGDREYAASDWPRCAGALEYWQRVLPKDGAVPVGREEHSVVAIETPRPGNASSAQWGGSTYALYLL